MSTQFITACQTFLNPTQIITAANDMAPFLIDWRKQFHGNAVAVLFPDTTEQVSQIVKLCNQYHIAITPQGGNTGLCGGATPLTTCDRPQIILSLQKLNRIRNIDIENQTITAEAGCVLQAIQQAAQSKQRLFPLSLASEGSCTLGGNLATNAGGTAVLRYGNVRDLCLGLEVVTATGDIWHGLRGLRKDNTGYDLKNLFIGSEGTLGIITAAMMKLFPRPLAYCTALVSVADISAAVALLSLCQSSLAVALTTFEIMSKTCLDLLRTHYPALTIPLDPNTTYLVLIEFSDYENEAHATNFVETLLNDALSKQLIDDAVLAADMQQAQRFWQLREHIPLAEVQEGTIIKHDIALPISQIPAFVSRTNTLLHQTFPDVRLIYFGHLGDGNLHYNVTSLEGTKSSEFVRKNQQHINQLVYEHVAQYQGSISAEHGIGQTKLNLLPHYQDPTGYHLMQAIKRTLDPNQCLNPGKVLLP